MTDKTDINNAIEPSNEKDENLEKRIWKEYETKALFHNLNEYLHTYPA